MIRQLLIIFLFFIIPFVLGYGLRSILFFTLQKKLVEDNYFYKSVKEMKGGANTPQEAWQGYLTALEKGDIEGALMYVWGDNREEYRKIFNELKHYELLRNYAENYSKEILKIKDIPEDNELAFNVKNLKTKNLSLLLSKFSPVPDITFESEKDYWAKLNKDSIIATDTIIFKYNPYTKKWFIK